MNVIHRKHGLGVMKADFAGEVKAVADKPGAFEGYGSVFGEVDSYRDVVKRGAFRESLADWKRRKQLPALLWQHRGDQPIGVYTDIREDEHGLRVTGQLLIDEVSQAREAHALIRAGAIRGLSIGYITRDDSYDEKTQVRTIKRADLWEVSLVTFPACQSAQVEAVKQLVTRGQLPTLREFEEFLREQGFSRSQAETIAAHGFKQVRRGDPGGRGDPDTSAKDILAATLSAISSQSP